MEEVSRLLNSVGKNTFLYFYPVFKKKFNENFDVTVEDMKSYRENLKEKDPESSELDLCDPDSWNDDSWNTKLSKTKKIFRET